MLKSCSSGVLGQWILGPLRMVSLGLLPLFVGFPIALISGGLGLALPIGVWLALYACTKGNIQKFRARVAAPVTT